MSTYYYKKLSPKERGIYRKLLDAVWYHMNDITVTGVTEERLAEIISMIGRDHPELFYVDFTNIQMTVSLHFSCTWRIGYIYTPSQIVSLSEGINKRIDDLLKLFQYEYPNAPALRRCIWVHDVFVKNISYDDEAITEPQKHLEAYNIVGVFQNRKAVCQGISFAAALLGERLGVSMPVIFGKGASDYVPGEHMEHSWNLMELGNRCYHADITWDLCLSKTYKYIRYDYFGLATDDIIKDHEIKYDIRHSLSPDKGCEMTFFEARGRNFSRYEESAAYIKKEMLAGRKIIYFKCRSSQESHEQLDSKYTRLIYQMISRMPVYVKSIEANHNPVQHIFLFRFHT